MLITGIEKTFAGFHHSTMNLEKIRKQITQNRRDQNPQGSSGNSGQKAPVQTIDQTQDQTGENKYQKHGNQDRIEALKHTGNQYFPE